MLKQYQVNLDPEAVIEIQEGIEFYDEQMPGLGRKFENTVNKHVVAISKNPFYQIRFKNIRCLPIKKYPYIILFKINESEQSVRVISRSRIIEKNEMKEIISVDADGLILFYVWVY